MRFASLESVGCPRGRTRHEARMRTYDMYDADGKLHAFEVDSLRFGRGGVVRVVRNIPGVRLTREPLGWLSWVWEDVFCEFELDGARFSIEEPFGDNSRYLISAEPPGHVPQMERVRAAFRAASLGGRPLRPTSVCTTIVAADRATWRRSRARLDLALAAAAFAVVAWCVRTAYRPDIGDSPLPGIGMVLFGLTGFALLAAAVGLRRGAAWGRFLHQVGLTWGAVVVLLGALVALTSFQ